MEDETKENLHVINRFRIKQAVYTLNAIAFLDLFAVSLFLPLINREIKNLGGTPIIMGLVTSVYGAIQLVSSPTIGYCADSWGRKYILVPLILLTAVSYVALGSSSSIFLVLLSRIIAGICKHSQTISKAILTDLAPKQKSYALGNFNAFGSMGYIVGPAIGGHMVEYDHGFRNVCFLASVIFVVNSILVNFLVPETLPLDYRNKKKSNNNDKDKEQSKWIDFSSITQIEILMLRFLFAFATLVPRANLVLILEAKYGVDVLAASYITSLQATAGTIAGFMVGPVLRKLYNEDNRTVALHGGIVHLISLLLLLISPRFELATASLILMSAVNPFQRVAITSMSLEGSTEHGAMLGLGQTSTSLARMLAPTAGGVAEEILHEDGPAVLAVSAAFLALISFVFCIPRRRAYEPMEKMCVS